MNAMIENNLLQDVAQEIYLEPASKGIRFANYIIDIIFFYIITFVVGMGIFGASALSGQNVEDNVIAGNSGTAVLIQYLISFTIMLAYYTILEGTSGRTLGKLITGSIAVKQDGSKLSWKDALLRSLCRMIPFEPFSALGVSPWHDSITRTIVIRKPR